MIIKNCGKRPNYSLGAENRFQVKFMNPRFYPIKSTASINSLYAPIPARFENDVLDRKFPELMTNMIPFVLHRIHYYPTQLKSRRYLSETISLSRRMEPN